MAWLGGGFLRTGGYVLEEGGDFEVGDIENGAHGRIGERAGLLRGDLVPEDGAGHTGLDEPLQQLLEDRHEIALIAKEVPGIGVEGGGDIFRRALHVHDVVRAGSLLRAGVEGAEFAEAFGVALALAARLLFEVIAEPLGAPPPAT